MTWALEQAVKDGAVRLMAPTREELDMADRARWQAGDTEQEGQLNHPLIIGYDDRYQTWFAQLYPPGEAGRECPVRVLGYTREEAAAAFKPPLPGLGATRVPTFGELLVELTRWGVHLR